MPSPLTIIRWFILIPAMMTWLWFPRFWSRKIAVSPDTITIFQIENHTMERKIIGHLKLLFRGYYNINISLLRWRMRIDQVTSPWVQDNHPPIPLKIGATATIEINQPLPQDIIKWISVLNAPKNTTFLAQLELDVELTGGTARIRNNINYPIQVNNI